MMKDHNPTTSPTYHVVIGISKPKPTCHEKVIHQIGRIRLIRRVIFNRAVWELEHHYAAGWIPLKRNYPSAISAIQEAKKLLRPAPMVVLPTRDAPVIQRVPGPIYGLKGFGITFDNDGPQLTSLADTVVWEGPVLTADEIPTIFSYKGIYSSKLDNPELAKSFGHQVVGLVELLGRVVEHQGGYRAERAIIRRIWLRKSKWAPLAEGLATRYQVEVM